MPKTTKFTQLPKLYKMLETMRYGHNAIIDFINDHKKLLKDPNLEANLFDLFKDDPFLLVKIAARCLKKRCPLFESAIIKHPHYTYDYALHVIEGRLPEDMHNMMIADNIRNPKDISELYFKFIKEQNV